MQPHNTGTLDLVGINSKVKFKLRLRVSSQGCQRGIVSIIKGLIPFWDCDRFSSLTSLQISSMLTIIMLARGTVDSLFLHKMQDPKLDFFKIFRFNDHLKNQVLKPRCPHLKDKLWPDIFTSFQAIKTSKYP